MMALSGFMIKDRAIPQWIRWVKYFSFMRYGYLGGIMVVLTYTNFDCGDPSAYIECDTNDIISGNSVLQDFGVNESYWLCIVLLFSLSAGWFLIAYSFLRKNTATTSM